MVSTASESPHPEILVERYAPLSTTAGEAALQALVSWATSTTFRQAVMTASEFPLDRDLPAFLAVNQLVFRGLARPTDLANALDTDKSNISKIVRRLDSAGLVERVTNPADGRGVVIGLSPAGREVGQRILIATRTLFSPEVPALTAEEAAIWDRLLLKLANALDALPEHPLTQVTGVRFHGM